MLEAANGLINGAALHAEHDITIDATHDIDDPFPVDNAVTAGAADWRAGHFATLGLRVLQIDILGMDVHHAIFHVFEPAIGIAQTGQIGVAGVKVNPNRR